MKKTRLTLIALLLMALLLPAVLAGCTDSTLTPTAVTPVPSAAPTEEPTIPPTVPPTIPPTEVPTEEPTAPPTEVPTEKPTAVPTEAPTEVPTAVPTEAPTAAPTEAPTAAPTEAPAAPKSYAGTTLTVYNWYDYIDPTVIRLFEEETGVKVEYVNFTTNEEMYTKLEATPSAYDVLFPSDYIIERLVKENMLAELDYANMPNAAGLRDWLKNPAYDEGGKHSVAYMWGTVGIVYNRSLTGRDIDSWHDLFSDEFKGSVLMMNSVRDTLGVALKALGHSMNSREPAELEAARDMLIAQKTGGISSGYLVDETKDKMVSGEAALALMWSGDALYAMEKNEDLAYVVPKEGSNVWVDGMCVPKASDNIPAAEAFIDFLCREDIARMNMDYIYYSTPIQAVVDGMDAEEAAKQTLNPPQDVIDRCEFFRDISEDMEMYEEMWMEIRLAR